MGVELATTYDEQKTSLRTKDLGSAWCSMVILIIPQRPRDILLQSGILVKVSMDILQHRCIASAAETTFSMDIEEAGLRQSTIPRLIQIYDFVITVSLGQRLSKNKKNPLEKFFFPQSARIIRRAFL